MDEIRERWDELAADWQTQVGKDGDLNRQLNSDPVLWQFAGDVAGKRVLDAGCGVGYLSKQLRDRGAMVTAVDLSTSMIRLASKYDCGSIDFRVDSCSELKTVGDEEQDLVVSNYVLMDTPDLDGTVRSFFRVLKPSGAAVLIFSHPCFPQGRSSRLNDPVPVTYQWNHSYFEPRRQVDDPWGHFKKQFIWFHRPLSDYWKAFRAAGFTVEEFEEPRLTPEREHLAPTEKIRLKSKTRPYSVAFKLRKPHS